MSKRERKALLLVEDERLVALGEKKTLERHGYRVVMAYSGEEAVETAERTPEVDLILMDIDLGSGMDGTEAARRILEHRDVPVVFLSGHTDSETVGRTEGITSYGYIDKGSGEAVLLASIHMAFRLFEAKQKEQERERSERMFRSITENAFDAIFLVDEHGVYRYANRAEGETVGLPSGELPGRSMFEFLPEDAHEAVRSMLGDLVDRRTETSSLTVQVSTAEGELRWIENRAMRLPDDEAGPSVLVISRDITEQRERHARIEALLREKELVLTESHHRVKNNMELFRALLQLRATEHDEPCRSVLEDAAAQARSMVLLYTTLYETGHPSELDLRVFLPPLVADILAAGRAHAEVTPEVVVKPVVVSAEKLTALGIIVEELVTNSIKHGFPGRKEGRIRVWAGPVKEEAARSPNATAEPSPEPSAPVAEGKAPMEVSADATANSSPGPAPPRKGPPGKRAYARVVYEDDGVGIAENAWLPRPTGSSDTAARKRGTSFGTFLVTELVAQLRGTIRVEPGRAVASGQGYLGTAAQRGGARFTIDFPA